MRYIVHDPSVYVVRWPDGIMKIGFTEHKRWRVFTNRKARLLDVFYFEKVDQALEIEDLLRKLFKYPRPFDEKNAAKLHLGTSGAGYLECRSVPLKVTDQDILSTIDEFLASFGHCYLSMLREHRSERCTDRQTDKQTDIQGCQDRYKYDSKLRARENGKK